MNLNLKGKTALVGGASQGLGAAVAVELALLGANVILMARREVALLDILHSLDISQQQEHAYLIADTNHPEQVKDAVGAYLNSGKLIHILVNNTGGPVPGPLLETNPADLETAFRSHLITAHTLMQAVVPGMKKAGYGRIINIVSTSVKQPIAQLGISNTVRAAVANWSKTLAGELGKSGITCNNVLPGSIKTARLENLYGKQAAGEGLTIDSFMDKAAGQIPAGRIGEAGELAAAVAFLCSPAAAYINGINLPVDGGKLGGL